METLTENELNVKNDKMVILNENDLKAKYGKVYKVEVNLDDLEKEFEFYFKAPTTASLNRCLKNMSKKSLQANLDFAKDNIIEEQKEEFEKICSIYMGVAQVCAGQLLNVVGFTDNVSIKKL